MPLGPFKDALALLEKLHGNVELGLLTDGYYQTQARKVAALGFGRFFKKIVYSDLLGREFWKPHSKPYEQIMEQFDSPGAEYVYIADNPNKDFVTAKKLGWRTIRVRRSGGEHWKTKLGENFEAHVEIPDLSELPL